MKDNKLKAEIGAIRWVLSKWTLEFERNRDTLRLQQLQVEEEREVDDYLQRIEGIPQGLQRKAADDSTPRCSNGAA